MPENTIEVNGKKYELIFSTAATMEVSEKFNGIENIAKQLSESSESKQFETVIWLINLMINQGIKRKNFLTGKDEPLMTEEQLALFTEPSEFSNWLKIVLATMTKDSTREIEVEEDGKNG